METWAPGRIPFDNNDLTLELVPIAELDQVVGEQAHALERAATEIIVTASYDEAESTALARHPGHDVRVTRPGLYDQDFSDTPTRAAIFLSTFFTG